MKQVCSKEARYMIENEELIIIDVRNQDEYEISHIKDALNIPLDQIENNLDKLDINKRILVYCKSGYKSKEASLILINNGYDVYNMYQGFNAYRGEEK